MPDGKIVQTLKEFVATANKGNYKDEKELMSYFPELKSYDTNLLKEFVATANKGNYKDENELFSYFPEFESKKKEKLPFQSSATPSPSLKQQLSKGADDLAYGFLKPQEKDVFGKYEESLQRYAAADNQVKKGIQVLPGMREVEINQLIESNKIAEQDAVIYKQESEKLGQEIIPRIQDAIAPLAGQFSTKKGKGAEYSVVPDYGKILKYATDMAATYGGGNYLKEVINQQMINQEVYSILEPELTKALDARLKKEKGLSFEQFAEAEQEKIKQLYTKKTAVTQQKIEQAKILANTEFNQKQKEINDKYKTLVEAAIQSGNQQDFDALTEQYYTEMKGIQRKINARLKRTAEELTNQFNKETTNLGLSNSTKEYLDKIYKEEYKKLIEKNLEAKKTIQDAEVSLLGNTGVAAKAFISSLLGGLSGLGSGLVGFDIHGKLPDFLRSFRTKSEQLETIDLPLSGSNLFKPQTYLTRAAKQLGFMATTLAPSVAITMLTKNPTIGALAAFGVENTQNAADVYNRMLDETNNPVLAQQASGRYFNRSIATLPTHFLELGFIMKIGGSKGSFVKNLFGEVITENIQEAPTAFLQQAEGRDAKSFSKWAKEDLPNLLLETSLSSFLTTSSIGGLGKLRKTLTEDTYAKNYLYNLLNSKGLNAANAILELQQLNGQITPEQLQISKENLAKVNNTIAELKALNLKEEQVEGYLALLAKRDDLREKLTKSSNPEIISAYKNEIEGINKELEKATLGKIKATTVEFTSGGRITFLGEPKSILSSVKDEVGNSVTIRSTDESVNKEAQDLASKVPQQQNEELENQIMDLQIELAESGITPMEVNGVLSFIDENGDMIDLSTNPLGKRMIELQDLYAKLSGGKPIQSFERDEVARQYAPVTDKMYEIEKEFAAQGFKIDTGYDISKAAKAILKIAVYDSEGNLVEPQQLPEGLKNLASQYEMAASMLGELREVAREKALATSRGVTEEAIIEEKPKQIEQNAIQKPSTEGVLQRQSGKIGETGSQRRGMEQGIKGEETAEEIKRNEEEKKLIEQTSTALKERGIQQSAEGKAIYALVPKKFYDKTKKPIVQIAEAYAEAKRNKNANPDLVKAVEDFLNPESKRLPLDQKGRRVGNLKYKKGDNHIIGRKITLRTPTGEKIKGTYKLVPAAELVPSHNPISFSKNAAFPLNAEGNTINDRDYEKGTDDRTAVSAFAQTLDSRAIEQTPWVSKEGIVYNGNNRTMSRQLAAKNETDKEYLEQLKEKAEMYGFTEEQVDSMQNPTLVFEVDENLPFTTKVWKMFNAEEKKAEKPGAVAIRISKTISDKAKRELSNLYEEAETASDVTSDPKLFKKAIDILVQDGVIQAIEIPKYSDKGVATPEGVALLERVILGASLNESAIETLMSLSMGNIKNAILKNVVGLMQNATKGENSLIPDITGAIAIIKKAKSLNSSVVDFLVSFDIFGENQWSIGEMSLAILLDLNSPNKLKTFLSSYNQDIGQQLMFGDSTKEGILNNLLNNVIPDYEKARKVIERAANRGTDETAKGAEKPNLQAAGTTPKNTISKERFSKLIERIKKAFPKINIISSAKEFAEKLKQYGIDAANLQAAANQKMVKLENLPDRAFAVGISKDKYEDLKYKIQNQGFTQPIIIDKETGNVLDGQSRLFIAERMGIKEVPAIYMDNPTRTELNNKIKKLENKKNESKVNFMRTPSGTIYGAQFPDGTVYINQEVINAETPIHELSHIWESMFPNEWKKGIELLRKSKGFQQALSEIKNNPFYANKTLPEQESEALNTLIGRKGEGYFQNEMLSKFKAWIRNLFIKIGEAFNIKISPDTKLNQFTNKVIGDILGGKEVKGELKGKGVKLMNINGKNVSVKETDVDVVNGFYSPLEKIISETKFDKLPAKQWAEKFAKGEEAKWTGLADWLAQQQGSISKADIQKFLKDNRISVVEVVKKENENSYLKHVEKLKKLGDKYNLELEFGDEGQLDITDKDNGESYRRGDVKSDRDINFIVELNLMSREKALAIKEIFDLNEPYAYDLDNIPDQVKFNQYQLEGEKENYKEVLVTLPTKIRADFQSTHFDEPNILVHLRMNTRKDADGKKVLFLEEIQSDWGQKGKKEGFQSLERKATDKKIAELWDKQKEAEGRLNKLMRKIRDDVGLTSIDEQISLGNKEVEQAHNEVNEIQKQRMALVDTIRSKRGEVINPLPSAPFVMDTNDWVKLGLKVALKEAVKQGADKIAWTTGEQQNDRYDLSKQVDEVIYNPRAKILFWGFGGVENVSENKIEDYIGKEPAKNLINAELDKNGLKIIKGEGLKVGGKGMKGFYGSPTEGSLGIVGNVAKNLFKQEPKTSNIILGGKAEAYEVDRGTWGVEIKGGTKYFESKKEAENFADSFGKKISIQHFIDITPELKSQVEKGLPLFMATAENTQAIEDFDKLNKKSINEVNEYVKKHTAKKLKQIKDITSNFGTYIANLEKSKYITEKIC